MYALPMVEIVSFVLALSIKHITCLVKDTNSNSSCLRNSHRTTLEFDGVIHINGWSSRRRRKWSVNFVAGEQKILVSAAMENLWLEAPIINCLLLRTTTDLALMAIPRKNKTMRMRRKQVCRYLLGRSLFRHPQILQLRKDCRKWTTKIVTPLRSFTKSLFISHRKVYRLQFSNSKYN